MWATDTHVVYDSYLHIKEKLTNQTNIVRQAWRYNAARAPQGGYALGGSSKPLELSCCLKFVYDLNHMHDHMQAA